MFVKPSVRPAVDAAGTPISGAAPVPLRVRDPHSRRFLRPEGEEVIETTSWHRLLRDGDVVLAAPPTPLPDARPAETAA